MPDPIAQTTLRDTLSAQFDAAQSDTAAAPVVVAPPAADVQPADIVAGETAAQAEQRARDEQGRFAAKGGKDQAAPATAAPVVAPDATQLAPAEPIARPTTWKRDYLPLYDKLARGEALTPEEARKLAPYMVQREKEFATGVSTYRAEAQNAKELQDAMTPFMGDLQQHNIKPATWISNLGNAHLMLVKGSPEQKLQMFSHLAQQYGVPLAAVGRPAGEIDPIVPQLMQHIQSLEGKVNTVTSWRETQEQQALQKEISKFEDAEKYPHFEAVRGDMAQLLESGVAKDLDQAYAKAVRLNDDVWTAEQERQALASASTRQAADKTAAAAVAKTRTVSTRTATPSGTAVNSGAKDRRSALSDKFDAMSQARV